MLRSTFASISRRRRSSRDPKLGSARAASSGSKTDRANAIWLNFSGVMAGIETRRLPCSSSARSAMSRRTASRTGIGLTPNELASPRSVIARPGRNPPNKICLRSSRNTCSWIGMSSEPPAGSAPNNETTFFAFVSNCARALPHFAYCDQYIALDRILRSVWLLLTRDCDHNRGCTIDEVDKNRTAECSTTTEKTRAKSSNAAIQENAQRADAKNRGVASL